MSFKCQTDDDCKMKGLLVAMFSYQAEIFVFFQDEMMPLANVVEPMVWVYAEDVYR